MSENKDKLCSHVVSCGSGIQEQLCSPVRLQRQVSARITVTEGWTGAGGTISKMTHRAVDGSPPFFSLLSIESPHNMVADFLQRQCTEGAAVSFVFYSWKLHTITAASLCLLEGSH